jgi:hypothetical protein
MAFSTRISRRSRCSGSFLITRLNHATDGTMVVPGEYLEVVIVKK